MRSKLLLVLAALLAFALVAAACGNDDDDTATSGEDSEATEEPTEAADDAEGDATEEPTEEATEEPTEEATEEPTEEATEEPTEEPTEEADGADAMAPQSGGELVVATTGETAGFDPTLTQGSGCCGGSQNFAIYGALVVRNFETGELEPLMAESFESDDGQTWTLVLKEGLMFTDGTPLNAEAVQANIERHQNTEGSVAASQASLVETTTVVDDLTLEITLLEPNAAFPAFFTLQLGPIPSPTAVEAEGENFNANPVGAGPFILDEWVPDDAATMSPNPDWFASDGPYVDSLVFRPISDDDQRLNTLLTGDIDVAIFRTPDPILEAEAEGFEKFSDFRPANQINNFNNEVAPFDDVRVRRAWDLNIDHDTLNEVIFDGNAIMNRGIVTEDSIWYNPDVELPTYDPEQARALIEEYEAENGEIGTITYTTGNVPEFTQVAEFLQAAMADIGLEVEIDVQELATFIASVTDGNYQVAQFGWGGHPDPATVPLEALVCDSSRNRANYCNERVDELFGIIASSTDFDERYEAYSEVQQIVADEQPMAVIRTVEEAQVWDPDVVHDVSTTESGILRTDLIWVTK